MVWYGMVWYDMVWYVMVWYGMVCYGMVWYGIYYIVYYMDTICYEHIVSMVRSDRKLERKLAKYYVCGCNQKLKWWISKGILPNLSSSKIIR